MEFDGARVLQNQCNCRTRAWLSSFLPIVILQCIIFGCFPLFTQPSGFFLVNTPTVFFVT